MMARNSLSSRDVNAGVLESLIVAPSRRFRATGGLP